MSLAINAAPFEADEPTMAIKAPRRKNVGFPSNGNNRTVKNRGNVGAGSGAKISADNINNVLMNVHDAAPRSGAVGGDDEMGEFMPIAPPESMRRPAEMPDAEQGSPLGYAMDNGDGHSADPYSSNTGTMDKYRQFMPNGAQPRQEMDQLAGPSPSVAEWYNRTGAGSALGAGNGARSDPILDKLNHVIHLLEEQQDDKTTHVTEEIILYFLLGVFVIFIVDSFTRLGKYTR